MADDAAACCGAAAELAALKTKFADWKARAKTGVEQQRAQLADATAELALAKEAKTAARDAAAAAKHDAAAARLLADALAARCVLLHAAAAAGPGAPLWASLREARGMATAAETAAATLRSQARSDAAAAATLVEVQREFERYKARSATTLSLTAGNLQELAAQSDAAAAEAERLREQLREATAALGTKDRTIAALEAQLEEAAGGLLALQAQLEDTRDAFADQVARGARAGDAAADGGGGARGPDGEAASRDDAPGRGGGVGGGGRAGGGPTADEVRAAADAELDALAAAHADEVQSMQLELTTLRMRLASLQAKAAPPPTGGGKGAATAKDGDDDYVGTLLNQLADARKAAQASRDDAASKQRAIERLEAKLTVIEGGGRAGRHSGGGGGGGVTVEELQRQLAVKAEQLWEANQELLQLRALSARGGGFGTRGSASGLGGPGAGGRGGAGGGAALADPQQQAYLRSVLVKLFCAQHDAVRGSLLPVVATMLQLTTDDLRQIYHANPEWRAP